MKGVLVGAVIAALASGSTPGLDASRRGRTWLTGAGIAALGLAVAAATLGIELELQAAEAKATLTAYLPTPEAVLGEGEQPAVWRVNQRYQLASSAGLALLIGAGVLVAGGVTALVLDRPAATTVSLSPTSGGALLVFSGRW